MASEEDKHHCDEHGRDGDVALLSFAQSNSDSND